MRRTCSVMAALFASALAGAASAAPEPPTPPPPPAGAPAPTAGASAAAEPAAPEPPKPAPYSLPWGLRPAAAASVARVDNVFAFSQDPKTSEHKFTSVTNFVASYKVTDSFAPMVRMAVVATPDSPAFANPVLGGTYVLKLPAGFRLGLFLGATIPVGSGGGDTPNPKSQAAMKIGGLARSAMDGAMFSPNDFSILPGIDFAWVAHGVTVQLEATLIELIRVRGSAAQPDSAKTNLTMGLHAGYFFIPQLSLGADLRYQRWLTTPGFLKPENDPTGVARDNLSFAVGPRGHFQLGKDVWFRPGIAYARGIDKPMAAQSFNIVQLDLPFSF